jgi:hypothetical protein
MIMMMMMMMMMLMELRPFIESDNYSNIKYRIVCKGAKKNQTHE